MAQTLNMLTRENQDTAVPRAVRHCRMGYELRTSSKTGRQRALTASHAAVASGMGIRQYGAKQHLHLFFD